MFISGNYPFLVRIMNALDPGYGFPLIVKRFYRKTYYLTNRGGDAPKGKLLVIEDLTPEDSAQIYEIQPGMNLAFPLNFHDEYLVLSASAPPDTHYKITAGLKAKCYPNKALWAPKNNTFLEEGNDGNNIFYRGGMWEIDDSKKGWTLTIRKYGPDPIDDDVIIGPDEPE